MSQGTENKPELPAPAGNEAGERELREDELDHVSGGLLVPAVQKVREAAARSSSADSLPTEEVSFTFEKIT